MPKVWIIHDEETDQMLVSLNEVDGAVPVDMNASLYRQIVAADKKYGVFQKLLRKAHKSKLGRRIT
jgi:hypothetical protein